MTTRIGRKIPGQRLPAPGKIRLGDILAIPLGENYWGYIRNARDASCQILDALSHNGILALEEIIGRRVLGYTSYCEPWDHPTWVYLGKWSFNNDSDGWAPPKYSHDVIDPRILKIYYKGQLTKTTDSRKIKGMARSEGLLFPGNLVVKIRQLQKMDYDRQAIGQFAPFTTA